MEALYWLHKFWVNNKNFDRLIGQNVNQEYFTPKPDLWKVVFWVLMTQYRKGILKISEIHGNYWEKNHGRAYFSELQVVCLQKIIKLNQNLVALLGVLQNFTTAVLKRFPECYLCWQVKNLIY